MRKACDEVTNKLESEGNSATVPIWFIPSYELIIDEWDELGGDGFATVHRAEWLGLEVEVKRLILADSDTNSDRSSFDHSGSSLSPLATPSEAVAATNAAKREEALKMFRNEVDIWFRFSHHNVVQLFGVCHVGRPFFVCELAANGTLVKYLQTYPDQLLMKLYEAALGVQYLHARGVVHGDLRGNNIVIGSDFKAKVTDFGLSWMENSETQALVSAAWPWLAPECFSGAYTRPTTASDVYSLGMCIVEALRVVEAARSGKISQCLLPRTVSDKAAVRYHAMRGGLPCRPTICEDNQWDLIGRMCRLSPEDRIKISTVVDELAKLATANRDTRMQDPIDVSVDMNSVSNTISVTRELLVQLQGSSDRRDIVLSLYMSLWHSLEEAKEQFDGNLATKYRHAFLRLISDAL